MGQFSSSMAAHPRTNEVELTPRVSAMEWKMLRKGQYLPVYIIMCLLKYRLMFLRVLKVFDEPLDESNIERRIKLSAGISK